MIKSCHLLSLIALNLMQWVDSLFKQFPLIFFLIYGFYLNGLHPNLVGSFIFPTWSAQKFIPYFHLVMLYLILQTRFQRKFSYHLLEMVSFFYFLLFVIYVKYIETDLYLCNLYLISYISISGTPKRERQRKQNQTQSKFSNLSSACRHAWYSQDLRDMK